MSDLAKLYRSERRANPYYGARTCLAIARMIDQGRGFWNASPSGSEYEAAEWRQDGYQMRAVVVIDQDPDISWLGEFTDDPDGAIRANPDSDHGTYSWFRPENPGIDNLPYFRAAGMGKADALARCAELDREAVEMAREPEFYGVTVTASLGGEVWGEATLWGVDDVAGSFAYAASVARDELAPEAAHEADAAIARKLGTVAEVIG